MKVFYVGYESACWNEAKRLMWPGGNFLVLRSANGLRGVRGPLHVRLCDGWKDPRFDGVLRAINDLLNRGERIQLTDASSHTVGYGSHGQGTEERISHSVFDCVIVPPGAEASTSRELLPIQEQLHQLLNERLTIARQIAGRQLRERARNRTLRRSEFVFIPANLRAVMVTHWSDETGRTYTDYEGSFVAEHIGEHYVKRRVWPADVEVVAASAWSPPESMRPGCKFYEPCPQTERRNAECLVIFGNSAFV